MILAALLAIWLSADTSGHPSSELRAFKIVLGMLPKGELDKESARRLDDLFADMAGTTKDGRAWELYADVQFSRAESNPTEKAGYARATSVYATLANSLMQGGSLGEHFHRLIAKYVACLWRSDPVRLRRLFEVMDRRGFASRAACSACQKVWLPRDLKGETTCPLDQGGLRWSSWDGEPGKTGRYSRLIESFRPRK